ncbi:MAG: hypothetical protein JXB26_07335 [Candidatus Aminicenantes bacterium]|nr:hypothetical protein [Candidatus Aminicenantes bacterium]
MKIKILSRSDVQNSVSMPEAISIMKKAFVQLSQGNADMPQRSSVHGYQEEGVALIMPAYLKESDSLGTKIVTVFPRNTEKNSPAIHAVFLLLNGRTGKPEAFMDASFLTALRTGAASGAATDLLARRNACTAAIFGAGVQGRTQLEAVCHVRNITKAIIYDKDRAAATLYAEEMKKRGKPIPTNIVPAVSPEDTVQEADIICTATSSSTPVFPDEALKTGVHINGIGSFTPHMQEIPESTIRRARIIVDCLSACLAEAGDLIIPLEKGLIRQDHIAAEIGDVFLGTAVGRRTDEEITFFKSVGLAVQDVAAAGLVWERAKFLGIGTEVEL